MGAIATRATARPADEAPHRLVLGAVLAGAVLAGAVLAVLAYTSEGMERRDARIGLACWLTLPYVVAGLVAWNRRPENRFGPLMVTAGFVLSAAFLDWSSIPLVFTIGSAVQFLPPALFLHVFLAFPSGRLDSAAARFVVCAAYVVATVTLPRLVLGGGDEELNLLAVTRQQLAIALLTGFQLAATSVLLLSGLALLVGRRRREGRPLRPWLGALVDSFAVTLPMVALLYVVQLIGWAAAVEPVRLVTFSIAGVAPLVFLAGVLQVRLSRASAGDLLVGLDASPGPTELQDAVVRALRDPSARLAYWLPEFGSFADVEGRPLDPGPAATRSTTPVVSDGALVAMLHHDPALEDEPELLSAVSAATAMTIHNARLQVELRARVEEIRGSRTRILQAEQRERRRLERDLHDGAQQRLLALSMELGRLSERAGLAADLRTRVEAARREVAKTLVELRDLAHGIHPAAVSDHGLAVAVESLATRSAVPVRVVGAPDGRLSEPVELAAFFVVGEALVNVARHARASSVVVELHQRLVDLVVEVRDDGVGGASTDAGTGLRGLADRVEAVGGRLQVWSPRGGGTRLRAVIPCAP